MFSLIIAIVSIALVVALVAATMYHGGDTLTSGRAQADAAGLVAGAEQIAGAYHLGKTLSGQDMTVTALVDAKHLSGIPAGFTVLAADELSPLIKPANGGMPTMIVDWNTSLSLSTCQALDKMQKRAVAESQSDYGNGQDASSYLGHYGCVADETMHFYFKL